VWTAEEDRRPSRVLILKLRETTSQIRHLLLDQRDHVFRLSLDGL